MKEDVKKIAPLDVFFPKIRVPSDNENMYENIQEDERNPAVKATKTMLNNKPKLATNTRTLILKKVQKIAPLDALFPKKRVPSDDEYMHEKTPAVKAAKTMPYAKSEFAKTYKEDGSRAETVMTMTLHQPTDCQDQTTSQALPILREQVDDEDQMEVKMAPFATEGAEGIAKCPSTWPAHFAAVTTRQHYTASFSSKAKTAVHLPSRSCLLHTLVQSCDLT